MWTSDLKCGPAGKDLQTPKLGTRDGVADRSATARHALGVIEGVPDTPYTQHCRTYGEFAAPTPCENISRGQPPGGSTCWKGGRRHRRGAKRQLHTSMERSLPTYQFCVMFSWFTTSAILLGRACTARGYSQNPSTGLTEASKVNCQAPLGRQPGHVQSSTAAPVNTHVTLLLQGHGDVPGMQSPVSITFSRCLTMSTQMRDDEQPMPDRL